MPKRFPETPGERRCISCDQRLVTSDPAPPPQLSPQTSAATVDYVCPDDHERWLYDSNSGQWRQMY